MIPQAESDFAKARNKALFNEISHLLNPEETKMISLQSIKQMVKTESETYVGMEVIPIEKIVGSEGRYKDFDNKFLPKNTNTKERWENVDEAVIKDIVLPPIRVYELAGVYFVRDGNHRVSVAKSKGVEFIDAEVVSLQTEIKLMPVHTLAGMMKQVVNYEKRNFYMETNFGDITDYWCLDFSTPGQYDVIFQHIQTHKYFINQKQEEEISMEDAINSWFNTVYLPVVKTIRKYGIMKYFKKSTPADLYVWIIRFYDELKKKFGDDLPLESIIVDIKKEYRKSPIIRFKNWLNKKLIKH